MSNSNHPSFRPNLNRNITRKWVEAQSVDYGGDDWGGDEYDEEDDYTQPQSQTGFTGSQRQPAWGQGSLQPAQRSFTNPTLAMNTGRQTFSRDEERRYVSSGGLDSRQLGQPAQSHISQSEMAERGYGTQLPLHVDTHLPGQSMPGSAGPASRETFQTGAPYSAPVSHYPQFQTDDRSRYQHASGINPQQAQQEAVVGNPKDSYRPRTSSLTQENQPLIRDRTVSDASNQAPGQSDNQTKAPLIIRPADIYKRVEQEREKERRSQESSRPSIDSGSGRAVVSSSRPADHVAPKNSNFLLDEKEAPKRNRLPGLDTVTERRGEYGSKSNNDALTSENTNFLLEATEAENPSTLTDANEKRRQHDRGSMGTGWTRMSNVPSTSKSFGTSPTAMKEQRISPSAAQGNPSMYTDRQTPLSASSSHTTPFAQARTAKTDSPQRFTFNYSPTTNKAGGLPLNFESGQDEDDLPNFDRGVSPKLSIASPTSSKSVKTAPRERQTFKPNVQNSASGKTQWQQTTSSPTIGTSARTQSQQPTSKPVLNVLDESQSQHSRSASRDDPADKLYRKQNETGPRSVTSGKFPLQQTEQDIPFNTSSNLPLHRNRQVPITNTSSDVQGQQMQPSSSANPNLGEPQQQQLSQQSMSSLSTSDTLHHQPPLGYRSTMDQAFDAENASPLPSAGADFEPTRSNSTGTTEVSPIIAKHSLVGHDRNSIQDLHNQTIPEESAVSHDRTGSLVTGEASRQDTDTSILPATTFVPGYRRNDNPMHTEESKAHRPLSIEIPNVPEAQHGGLANVNVPSPALRDPSAETLAATKYTPLPTSPTATQPMTSQGELAPPTIPRTTSEDWQEWQAQRRQFNAKHGIQESNTASPAISSPVSRAESPAKGTVRDIAGKLESNSGRSSPVNASTQEVRSATPQKPSQARNDSFRPVLPGGWSSYATDADNSERLESPPRAIQRPLVQEHNRTESTDSIPTARAPKQRRTADDGPMNAAFAAAAAAGSAVVGAFAGSAAHTRDTPQSSDVNTDDEDLSGASRPHPREASETRDFAQGLSSGPRRAIPTGELASHTSTAPKDVSDEDLPSAMGQRTDFPAPLRMNRSGETKQSSPRMSVPSAAAIETHHDPEQLQNDIVQSLTPKTSSIDDTAASSARVPLESAEPGRGLHRQVSIVSVDDDVLPQEYRSYWDNQQSISQPTKHQNEFVPSKPTSSSMEPLSDPLSRGGPDESSSVPTGLQTPVVRKPDSSTSSSIASTSPALAAHTGELNKPTSAIDTASIPATRRENIDTTSLFANRPPIPTVVLGGTHELNSEPSRHMDPIPLEEDMSKSNSNRDVSPVSAMHSGSINTSTPMVERPLTLMSHEDASSKSGSAMARSVTPELLDTNVSKSNSTMDKSPISATQRDNISKSSSYSVKDPVIPPVPMTGDVNVGSKPFLDHRYSWETPLEENKGIGTESREVIVDKGMTDNKPSTPPPQAVAQPPSIVNPPTPTVSKVEEVHNTPHDAFGSGLPAPKLVAASAFPQPKANFRNILSFNDSSQRIRAFDENRKLYAEPSGLLEQWLSHMNVPEHAEVFQASRLPYTQQNLVSTEARPSPRRDVVSASGTKQMQEDGKRLLAAAGKYGGKAGTVAKGIFARGKDRFRSASYGEKAPPYNRRQSSNSNIDTSSDTRSQEPMVSERPPQLPTPPLETPPGEPGWSTLSSRFDQMFRDRTQQPAVPLATASGLPASNARYTAVGNTAPPPRSVVQSLPGTSTASARPQPFPNYDVGVEPEKTTISSRSPQISHQPAEGKQETLARVSTEDDRPIGHTIGALPILRERPSSVSDVSDVSAHPDETKKASLRDISPAHEHAIQEAGLSSSVPQRTSKQDEALAEQERDRSSHLDGNLPAYTTANSIPNETKQPRVAPGAHIVPIAAMHSAHQSNDQQVGSRPFSFVGSETLNHAMAQQVSLHAQSVAEEGLQPSNGRNMLEDPEKSPQPNITEHPAYRNISQNSSVSRTENPLPSSRRPDLDELRRSQQGLPSPREPEGEVYRIPGPYVQEYRSPRSPKQTSAQEPFQDSATQGILPVSSGLPLDRQSEAVRNTGPEGFSSQIEQRPGYDRSRGRSFGSLFRTRSKSPTRRKGFFIIKNRSSSPSRQIAEQDRDGPIMQEGGRGKKLSMDLLRPSGTGAKTQAENKWKRSSGLGGIFGKSNYREKDSQYIDRGNSMATQEFSQPRTTGYNPVLTGQNSVPSSAIDRPYDYADVPQDRQPDHQFASLPAEERQPLAGSAYNETRGYRDTGDTYNNQAQASKKVWPNAEDMSPIYAQSQGNTPTVGSGLTDAYHATSGPSGLPNSGYSPIPTTRASKDISYGQERPYAPPDSPVARHGYPKSEPRENMASHVTNLHKRSRSPRLGRAPSDDDVRGTSSDPANMNSPIHNLSPNPASQLGTFSNKKISPAGGIPRSEEEQEKPWIIGLPDEGEDDRAENADRVRSQVRSGMPQPYRHHHTDDPSALVSPSTPHFHGQHDSVVGTVSPVTAIEPRDEGLSTSTTGQRLVGPTKPEGHRVRFHDDENLRDRHSRTETAAPEILSVPPSISNANQIPIPNALPHQATNTDAQDTSTSADQARNLASSQASRGLRQAAVERTPESSPVGLSTSRPLTVAEKVMGIQPAARGTNLEHRSTTPVPHSPAPSIGVPPKSTTWPDANPSTAAITTTSSSGTFVTTTTIRGGSKLGRDNVRTSTYVVDSNTPSRTGSNAGARANRQPTSTQADILSSGVAPSAAATTNTNGKDGLRTLPSLRTSDTESQRMSHAKSFDAVELPGSKPDGYESEEEPMMSATAWPGQEWLPDFSHGMQFED